MNRENMIETAVAVFDDEIKMLSKIRNVIGDSFIQIENAIINCEGKVILCGMGKSGHIARKISATLASLGTPSFFLHPAEAMHGDLGMISKNDIVILISNSGETSEIIKIIPSIKVIGTPIIGITGKKNSTLYKESNIVQLLDTDKEACHLNLAPTSSTTAALVYGDALAVTASVISGFSKSDFGLFHPAGTLGKTVLTKVKDIMAVDDDIPVIVSGSAISEAIIEMSQKSLGVVAICNSEKQLLGILTDGDLRRAIEKKINLYSDIVDNIMTVNPQKINDELLVVDVLRMLKESHLNNYPVVDDKNHIIGMITWQMIIREGIIL